MPTPVHLQALSKPRGPYYRLRWTTADGPQIEALGYVSAAEAEERRRRKEAELLLGIGSTSSSAAAVRLGDVLRAYGRALTDRHGVTGYVLNVARRTVCLLRHLADVRADLVTTEDLETYAYARRAELGGRRGNRTPKKSVIVDELKLLVRALT